MWQTEKHPVQLGPAEDSDCCSSNGKIIILLLLLNYYCQKRWKTVQKCFIQIIETFMRIQTQLKVNIHLALQSGGCAYYPISWYFPVGKVVPLMD